MKINQDQDKRQRMSQQEIDEYNLKIKSKCESSSHNVYICSKCRQLTCIDDSFSNILKNMICCRCTQEAADKLNMSTSQYLDKYVWNNDPPNH